MARHSRESGNPVFVCMFFSGFRPLGEVLFFAPPKKSTQKKGVTDGLPATRVPCASREDRRLRNSRSRCTRLAQTGRKLNPVFTAMLGCANGIKVKTHPQPQIISPRPVCTHRVPQTIRDQARALFERDSHSETASCASAGLHEKRREPA